MRDSTIPFPQVKPSAKRMTFGSWTVESIRIRYPDVG